MKNILFILLFISCVAKAQLKKELADDKFKHDQAGMVISGVASSSAYFFGLNAWQATGIGFLFAGTAGTAKELYDKYSGNGTPDVMDAVSTGFGGARMCIMWRIGVDHNERKRLALDTTQYQNLLLKTHSND